MRWAIFLTVLLVLPMGLADGWYYAGDTFEEDGVLYSVEGVDHYSVLLGIGGKLHFIPFEGCIELGFKQYCYEDTAFPDTENHIKYEAGDVFYAYNIQIIDFEPDVLVTTEIEPEEPSIGETIVVTVTVENTGDYALRDVTYTADIPSNVRIIEKGPGYSDIEHVWPSFMPDSEYKFQYRLLPADFIEFSIKPNLTYEYQDFLYWVDDISKTDIEVFASLDIDIESPSKLDVDQWSSFNVSITNEEEYELDLDVTITIPNGLWILGTEGYFLNERDDGVYNAKFDLKADQKREYSIKYFPIDEGEYVIFLDILTTIKGRDVHLEYNHTFEASEDKLVPEITLGSNYNEYLPGAELTIRAILDNPTSTEFDTIRGKFSSSMFDTIPFSHDKHKGNDEVIEAEFVQIIPPVREKTTYKLTFAGTYFTPSGEKKEFSKEESVIVIPFESKVKLIRKVVPKVPVKGENVTITVELENIYDEYVTVDVYEKYSSLLTKITGLTYAEKSIERDKDDEMYAYQLDIPENFPYDSFNVTTSVLVKGDLVPEEFTTEILLTDAPGGDPLKDDTNKPVVKEPIKPTLQPEKKEGFIGRIWGWLKGFFGFFSSSD